MDELGWHEDDPDPARGIRDGQQPRGNRLGRMTWPGQVAIGVHDPAGRTWLEDAFPPHRVRITQPFYLGIHEVTQDAYERVMGVNPSGCKEPRHPVETVHWNDAVEFCHRLAALPAEKAAGRVYRLPTEAEWEFACRAGTTTPYHFGDDPSQLEEYAWYGGGRLRAGAGAGMGSFLPLPHTRLDRRGPMSGASLTCSAMCRNGATTCTALTTTGKPRLKIRRDRSWGLVVCTGVVHGSSVRVPAGQHPVPVSLRTGASRY